MFGISLLRECLISLQVTRRILETVYKTSLIGFHPRQASEWTETAGCNKHLVSNWLANPSSLGFTTRIISGSMQFLSNPYSESLSSPASLRILHSHTNQEQEKFTVYFCRRIWNEKAIFPPKLCCLYFFQL